MTISLISLRRNCESRAMLLTTDETAKRRYAGVAEGKVSGATYTPRLVADFVAARIVEQLHPDATSIRALDPAVGDGELLMRLLEHLPPQLLARTEVHGFETDATALATASRRLNAAFPQVRLNFRQSDFLASVLDETAGRSAPTWAGTASLFDEPAATTRFDVIIANPPYVRTQIIGAEQAGRLAKAFSLTGRVDLYHAFMVGMAHVLQPGGTAGFVVSNRFMSTRGSGGLRAALRERLTLRHVWDLGDTKLFDAAVLPAVIVAGGTGRETTGTPRFTAIYQTQAPADATAPDAIAALALDGTVALPDGRRFDVRHGSLDEADDPAAIWRIANPATDAWLETVQRHTWNPFGAIGKIRVGVKTCADDVFIRSDWNAMSDDARPELLFPLTTHHIGERFRARANGVAREILYPHQAVQGQRRAVDLSRFPRTRAYLERHRTALTARKYVMESGRNWYEIWVPQNPDLWQAPKLVFRDISERPTFWMDLDGTVVNGDCYWLACARPNQTDLLWLAAAVANSRFIEAFYDHRFNNKLYAGRRRFITQYVEQFPLPDPDTPLAREIVAIAKGIHAAGAGADTAARQAALEPMILEAFGLGLVGLVGQ